MSRALSWLKARHGPPASAEQDDEWQDGRRYEDRSTLTTWTRSSRVSAGHAERAAIVLACAEGAGTSEAARRLGVSRPTVIKWRDRFASHGMAGLDDEPRSGRPKNSFFSVPDGNG